jgi:hypothetical protein
LLVAKRSTSIVFYASVDNDLLRKPPLVNIKAENKQNAKLFCTLNFIKLYFNIELVTKEEIIPTG